MPNAMCPECENLVSVTTPKTGKKVVCSSCEAELEVVSLKPLELDWADDEDDDDYEWDDDDDDDEDDDWDD